MVVGHSRLGKAALWVGVCDERFFVSNCSGCGGSAIAPRMLHISSASRDGWADPDGELLSALLATEAFERHGLTGLPLPSFFHSKSADFADACPAPDPEKVYESIPPIGGTLRYHRRGGVHDITTENWNAILNHADAVIEAKNMRGSINAFSNDPRRRGQ